MVQSTTVCCIVLFLLLVNTVHSWDVEEWGDPFQDSRFRRLPKECTFGRDQWDCVPHSECQGLPTGTCYCMNGYINPDLPGADTTKTGLRCLGKNETTISNNDPRWKETFLPCTVNCTASQAECSKASGNCVCLDGYIGDPAKRHSTCKAVSDGFRTSANSFLVNVFVMLVAIALTKNV